jgi:transposase
MIYVGIDVAKNKHDCFITNSDGKVLCDSLTIQNNRSGFDELYSKVMAYSGAGSKIKVGLEATGHYSYNLLGFLLSKDLDVTVINPLRSSLYGKGQSLRKTKTDKHDSHSIAAILRTENLKPYSPVSYHISELKSLTRYRFSLVRNCSRMKASFSRLVVILFPELESLVSSLHSNSVYSMMLEFPNAQAVASCHLTRLSNLLSGTSNGRFGKDKAAQIKNAAKISIGSYDMARSFEIQQTIRTILLMEEQIKQVEEKINPIVDSLNSPIMTIPGISYRMGAMILAEIGDFRNFDSAEKILAYAGMEPSVYQSGQSTSTHAKMVKRGSKYLRFALFNAAKYVCRWDPTFAAYLNKKRREGKLYNVAVSHTAKKLVRVMYHLEITGQSFQS